MKTLLFKQPNNKVKPCSVNEINNVQITFTINDHNTVKKNESE